MNNVRFENVTAQAVAHVYFDGKVLSHALLLADGSRKTLGVIFPGTYRFDTNTKETMLLTAGSCAVRLQGENDFRSYNPGQSFDIPAQSAFDIVVKSGLTQYVCSYG